MREVEHDAVLRRGDDLPKAALSGRVQIREGGTGDGSVGGIESSTAGVCNNNKLFHFSFLCWLLVYYYFVEVY